MNTTSLLRKYLLHTPSFSYVSNKYLQNNIKIDHIAHRSINDTNISYILDYYIKNRFQIQPDIYNFPRFNVKAYWLKSEETCPLNYRIFLSKYIGEKIPKIFSYNDYINLQEENQYLAWTLLHSYDINHVAVKVNNIENFLDLIVNDRNLQLATSLQISKDGKLKQFSLQADTIDYKFPDGVIQKVPYTFVEFIERIDAREGFESENADKIFDSTKQKTY